MSADNITAYLISEGSTYENLIAAATFADLVDALAENPKTLFIPTDSLLGLDEVPMVNRWNKQLTQNLLLTHVLGSAGQLNASTTYVTLEGTNLTTSSSNLQVSIVGPNSTTDQFGISGFIDGNNYSIYDVDAVLVPASQFSIATVNSNLFSEIAVRVGALADLINSTELNDLNATFSTLPDEAILYNSSNAYTVFLPTQSAFTDLLNEVQTKPGTTEYLAAGGLASALSAHVITGSETVTTTDYTSLSGSTITVTSGPLQVEIANEVASILNGPGSEAIYANGQVHNIDKVLQFPRNTTTELAVATASLDTLASLVVANNIDLDALNVSTIFAPTNDALLNFAAYADWYTALDVEKVLLHHVVSSRLYASDLPTSGTVATALSGEVIDRSDIEPVSTDVLATNGNIHIVSQPLIPPTLVDALPSFNTVLDIAVGSVNTTILETYVTLVPAIVTLLNTLEVGTSFTVFAPVDSAFAILTDEDLAYLTDNNNAKLTELLSYHVVSSAALSSSLVDEQTITTAIDETLKVSTTDGVFINSAKVVQADVQAYNGVVHLIDSLLVPSGVILPSTSSQTDSGATLTVSVFALGIAGMVLSFVF